MKCPICNKETDQLFLTKEGQRCRACKTVPASAPKPFGWDVEVEFWDGMVYCPGYPGNWRKTFHYKGPSESTAKKRAMAKPHAQAVLSTKAWATEADYVHAYGNYWERGC
jgi:hypothetical protein